MARCPVMNATETSTAALPPIPTDNPLTWHGGLPRFDAIRTEHVVPAVKALVARQAAELEALEGDLVAGRVAPSWTTLMERLVEITEPLAYAWGITGHLMSVANS